MLQYTPPVLPQFSGKLRSGCLKFNSKGVTSFGFQVSTAKAKNDRKIDAELPQNAAFNSAKINENTRVLPQNPPSNYCRLHPYL